MKGRGLLALAVLSLALACEGNKLPTGPTSPSDPSKVISDGAHSGGNPDFFFLPPLVPLARNMEIGKFNRLLGPSLKIVICELNPERDLQNVVIRPKPGTTCAATKKTFDQGSVKLVTLPLRQNGWWNLFRLPPDGFYYVLWDTRQSDLKVDKYYRIKVFAGDIPDPLGYADVDPMSSLREWKYTLTGEVIQIIDDIWLPIPFRVETGALCAGGPCTSATYDNSTPLSLRYEPAGPGLSIAGVFIPAGALPSLLTDPTCTPARCPQSVIVNITQVDIGPGGLAVQTVCHPALNPKLQQFKGCFNFTTTPELRRINEAGDQFIKDVTVAVCYELEGTGDPREKFAELYSSGPTEAPRALRDVGDAGLLGVLAKDCTPPPPIGVRSSNPLTQLASTGWRTLKGGLGRVFGIETAYAIDLGLGGITRGFSNISPVLTADIIAYTNTELTLGPGSTTTSTARIVGNSHHSTGTLGTGIGGLPVTFTPSGGSMVRALGTGAPPASTAPITVTTNINPIVDGSPVSGGGFAPVNWTMPTPTATGTYTYTLTADGPALGGPVTFTSTVTIQLAPVLAFTGSESYTTPAGNFVRYNLAVTNYQAYPAEMFAPRPDLPPCGLNTSASRTWVDIYNASNNSRIYGFCGLGSPSELQSIWFAEPLGTPPPALVYIKLLDRATNVTYTSNSVAPILPDLVIFSGDPVLSRAEITTAGGTVTFPTTFKNLGGSFALVGGVRIGFYLSDDPIITSGDRLLGSSNPTPGSLEVAGGSMSFPMLGGLVPAGLGPGVYYVGMLIDDNNAVAESDESNNYSSSPLVVTDVINFETYPGAVVRACNGLLAGCPVSNQFASRGVVFSLDPSTAGHMPFLCRPTHHPVDEASSYGVSPEANADCNGWINGTVVMSFESHPHTVAFRVEGNDLQTGPFPVTALDANGSEITNLVVTIERTYSVSGNTWRRESWQFTSPTGIASVAVNSVGYIHIIDNLLITP